MTSNLMTDAMVALIKGPGRKLATPQEPPEQSHYSKTYNNIQLMAIEMQCNDDNKKYHIFPNFKVVVQKILEDSIDAAFKHGNNAYDKVGFGQDTP